MGTLFSTLDIGRAGLQVAQVQLDVTGHNIANVNREGYSRQRVNLTTYSPLIRPYGAVGRGPAVQTIERLRENFLDQVYRAKLQDLGFAEVRARYYNRVEDVFLEPGDQGFGTQLGRFFDALSDFASNVEDIPTRAALVSEADALAGGLNAAAARINTLRTNANEEVRGIVPEINSLLSRIAELNPRIRSAEANGRPANDLRDDRDALMDELARLVNITYRERDDGQVDVLIGGASAVSGNMFDALEAVVNPALDPVRGDLLEVRFSSNGTAVDIRGGELHGVLVMRDGVLADLGGQLDTLAAAFIEQMNRIHSQGNGIANMDTLLRSVYPVNGAGDPLSATGLPFPVQDGSFDLVVYDSAGNIASTQTITIVASGPPAGQTRLTDVIGAINATPGVGAFINADNTFTIAPTPGFSFSLANDTSGVLAALGVNSFFTGTDASTIAVSDFLRDHPEFISSAFNPATSNTGDNSAALALSALRTAPVLAGGTRSFSEFYESLIVEVGIDARANGTRLAVEQAVIDDYSLRRQEVSGVNLDEEVTFLLQVQRAFEGAARIITVTDRMLETLVNIVR